MTVLFMSPRSPLIVPKIMLCRSLNESNQPLEALNVSMPKSDANLRAFSWIKGPLTLIRRDVASWNHCQTKMLISSLPVGLRWRFLSIGMLFSKSVRTSALRFRTLSIWVRPTPNCSAILRFDKCSFSDFLITSTRCSKVRALRFFGGILSI